MAVVICQGVGTAVLADPYFSREVLAEEAAASEAEASEEADSADLVEAAEAAVVQAEAGKFVL